MTDACLDEGRVIAFLEGTLSADDRSAVEDHLSGCRACAELTTWAAAEEAHHSRMPGLEGRALIGPLPPGSRVDRYQILGAVGRGGMGAVYAAYHPDLDRRIALKVVGGSGGSGAGAPEQRARLLREARAIARLSHPNVVAVYDAGTVDDRVYIAMEFVEGETVKEWLHGKPRGWREVLQVFLAAGRGLAAAHAAGIIHRDFKPQNVMMGRDGSVRVMDFGLARLETDLVEPRDSEDAVEPAPVPPTVSRVGAQLGTIAYMSPEQFRGDPIDARADQFSFCVALYEALHGTRPRLRHRMLPEEAAAAAPLPAGRTSGVPAWLRALVARGMSDDREQRFPSMEALLAAAGRGRDRVRRRTWMGAVAAATLLVLFGAWRLAAARRISCTVPRDRIARAWTPGDASAPRREAIHHAFAVSGRPTAEATWQRVAKALDVHVSQWSAMYVDTCEATHVRGEQSADVLDLRMACLGQNLDEVRALTDALLNANDAAVAHALSAVQGLTGVGRCADVAVLRTAVPLPREAATLAKVQELQASLRNIRSLVDLGNLEGSSRAAAALRPQVEAVGYKPLMAELLELIGLGMVHFTPATAEPVLESAFMTAEAAGDDETAAKTAAHLTYVIGYHLKRPADGKRWAAIAGAILDRMGPGHDRIRAWLATSYGAILATHGDMEGARKLFQESVSLKERTLGPDHPDVALTLSNLALARMRLGQSAAALEAVDRALAIQNRFGDPDTFTLASLHTNRADILAALGREREAEQEFTMALSILRQSPTDHENRSQALHGLGALRLSQGRPAAALPLLEQALAIREPEEVDQTLTADTRFALARALWDVGGDRRRARQLATAAREGYTQHHQAKGEEAVETWLAAHKAGSR